MADLLGSNLDFSAHGAHIVPPVKTRIIKDDSGIPIRVENYIDWNPKLFSIPAGIVTITVNDQTTATVQVLVTTEVKTGASSQALTGEIRNFQLEIAQAILVPFNGLSFRSDNGQGVKITVDIGSVQFKGGLAFLAKLQDKFGSSLFGKQGPRISVEGSNIVARAGFNLPNISIGVFAIQHLSVAAVVTLPLLGNTPLSLGVDFASRQDHFVAAVGILGGGGYLMLRFGPDGVQSVEFSIEAGGVVSLDLAVAHGSAHVMIGVGMTYDRAHASDGLTLILFLRAGGSLDVLGIITISVEFTLTFSYRSGDQTVCAECTLTVSISILFFHADVNVTMKRCLNLGGSVGSGGMLMAMDELGGSNIPPPEIAKFEDLISESAWEEYCEAFARFEMS